MKTPIIVPRQSEAWSCGPASVVTAGRLLGLELAEQQLIVELESKPITGTSNSVIAAWCKSNLPVKSVGERTYVGGLAIWNIKNAISGNGHFVVVLGERGSVIRYYDPYWSRVLQLKKELIDFRSGDNKLHEWSINFETIENFYDAILIPDMEFNDVWALNSLRSWLSKTQAYNPDDYR